MVSICVIFIFLFFFLFFKLRNEDYLHGSNKHSDLHSAKICIRGFYESKQALVESIALR